jgi:transposase
MKPRNKYFIGTHISEHDFKHLLKEFCRDTLATEASERVGISRVTVNRVYQLLRVRIYTLAREESREMFTDESEIDESYFGAHRIRGKRGRGALGKIPVFGILKRGGKVYTQIVENCSRAQLLPILQGKVLDGTRVYSDGWRAYDGLVYNYDHYRVHHSHNEFARGKNHINGIESFWSWAKRRMRRFNGIRREQFPIHLKECEWRFNHRTDNLYAILIKTLREYPLESGAKVI